MYLFCSIVQQITDHSGSIVQQTTDHSGSIVQHWFYCTTNNRSLYLSLNTFGVKWVLFVECCNHLVDNAAPD